MSLPGSANAFLPSAGMGTVWEWCVQTHDVDAHAQAQPGWDLHYEQLSGGSFSGLVHHVMLPMMRMVHERCSAAVRQTGRLEPGRYGFAMALDGAEPAIFNGQRVERDAVMLGRHGELDLCTPPHHALIAVVVDNELLAPLWQHLYGKPPSGWMESQLVVPARPASATLLRGLHLQAMADASTVVAQRWQRGDGDVAARQLRDALLIEWLEALPESVDAAALPTALARKRLVDQACDLMLSDHDEPLSMLQVCRQVGASRRKLATCFQEVLGTSPARYLRAVRLNGVRRDLRNSETATPTIQVAAARWGFWHMGQFARDYKRQFGELPSATRAGRATATAVFSLPSPSA